MHTSNAFVQSHPCRLHSFTDGRLKCLAQDFTFTKTVPVKPAVFVVKKKYFYCALWDRLLRTAVVGECLWRQSPANIEKSHMFVDSCGSSRANGSAAFQPCLVESAARGRCKKGYRRKKRSIKNKHLFFFVDCMDLDSGSVSVSRSPKTSTQRTRFSGFGRSSSSVSVSIQLGIFCAGRYFNFPLWVNSSNWL